jgi:DNA invertase Pin-like site-specific DNA recombinase
MTTCAIYIRKSREEKDKPSHRLTVQREQLPAYAAVQGWNSITYDDGHASAAQGKTSDLKERARLEADIRSGTIDIILCIELSRLSRDDSLQDYVAWLDLCSRNNVRLATMSRILDPAQHSDWMLLLMEGGFSSVEMKVLQGRMKEGRQEAFRSGKFMGGLCPPPYIYDKATGKPTVDPDALKRMQQLWSLAEQHGTRHISQVINMPLIAIRRAISDERLLYYQALRQSPDGGDMIPCDWQPVMTAEQAALIKARRTDRIKGYHRRESGGLLSAMGILVCGYCGRSCRSWANSRDKATWYGCKANEHARTCQPSRLIQQQLVDHAVTTHVLNTLADQDQLRSAWEANQGTDDSAARIKEINREISTITDRKQRLIHAITEGVIELADAKQMRMALDAELQAAETSRGNILSNISTPPDWQAMAVTAKKFHALDTPDQREIIRLSLAEIRLYSSYATCTYRFPRDQHGSTSARIHLPPKLSPGRKPL